MDKLKNLFTLQKRDWGMLIWVLPVLLFFASIYVFTDKPLGLHLRISSSSLKAWDKNWGFWAIHIVFILSVLGWIVNGKEIWLRLKTLLPSPKTSLILFAIVLFCGIFTWTQVEKQHRVLSDESSWESMALQMYYHHRGGTCNQGWFHDNTLTCTEEVNNFKGKASGYLYYLLYHIASPTRNTALQANFVLYILSLFLFFQAVFIALKRALPALSATAVLGTFPIMMMQAQTATTEVLYVFLLALLMVVLQLLDPEKLKWKHMLLIIPLMGLFAQTRQESLFGFLPFVFWMFPFFRKRSWHLAVFTLLLILASWPIINTIIAYKGYDFQGGDYAPNSLENFAINLWANIKIMLNLDPGIHGLLKYPFSSTMTVLLLVGTVYLVVSALTKGRHIWGAFLVLALQLQAFLILLNVSGHFSIDINQRYILVALPVFALIIALFTDLFFTDLFQHFKRIPFSGESIASYFILALCLLLPLAHAESFRENIMYRKNKLLLEEKVLDTQLKEYPKNSIFIYARPWQMLCSGFNSFSESRFLAWNKDELDKWNIYSENNIYLVRGQDGYGKVNRKSRVVGFKSTTKVDQILNKYNHETLYKDSKNFGYPLTVFKLNDIKNRNPLESKISVQVLNKNVNSSQNLTVKIGKQFSEPVFTRIHLDKTILTEITLQKDSTNTSIQLISKNWKLGPHTLSFQFALPADSNYTIYRNIFIHNNHAKLLSEFSMKTISQGWGSPHKNRSVENAKLSVSERHFEYGIGTHAPSEIHFNLNGKYSVFNTLVGMDNESLCGDGVTFIVQGDGKELARSKQVHAHELDSLSVSVAGVQKLELLTFEGENTFCDHADWLNSWVQ